MVETIEFLAYININIMVFLMSSSSGQWEQFVEYLA